MEDFFEKFKEYNYLQKFLEFFPRLVIGLLVLLAGWYLIKVIIKLLNESFKSKEIDISITGFLLTVIQISLRIILFITLAAVLGFNVTSLITVLGAAGLAVGLALQGSLSNFAGSLVILVTKPYKIGDYVDINNIIGTVTEIKIFTTVLTLTDNRLVYIPNKIIVENAIINFTQQELRRIEISFSIQYSEDLKHVRNLLLKELKESGLIESEPAPLLTITQFSDIGVLVQTTCWVKTEFFWQYKPRINDLVLKTLQENNIRIAVRNS